MTATHVRRFGVRMGMWILLLGTTVVASCRLLWYLEAALSTRAWPEAELAATRQRLYSGSRNGGHVFPALMMMGATDPFLAPARGHSKSLLWSAIIGSRSGQRDPQNGLDLRQFRSGPENGCAARRCLSVGQHNVIFLIMAVGRCGIRGNHEVPRFVPAGSGGPNGGVFRSLPVSALQSVSTISGRGGLFQCRFRVMNGLLGTVQLGRPRQNRHPSLLYQLR